MSNINIVVAIVHKKYQNGALFCTISHNVLTNYNHCVDTHVYLLSLGFANLYCVILAETNTNLIQNLC